MEKLLVECSTNSFLLYFCTSKKIGKMQEFIYALLMMQSSYRQAIQKRLKEFNVDLTFEMLQIMRCLYRRERVNQQELANQTFKDKSSLSYLLNNMEKRQLVARLEDENDKRNKLIVLTDEGQALHEQIKSLIETVYNKVEEEIDKKELQLCTNYMKELSQIVSND